MFQGNEGTFVGIDDTEERIETLDHRWIMRTEQPFNTFKQDRDMQQHVFKVIDGSVKDPELESGYNGRYGYFTGDDIIISFSEEAAQTFLADIEGRNTGPDKITRLKEPPTPANAEMSVTVDGDDGISITGEGGIVESYAIALDSKQNPNNLPETAQEATARRRAGN